MDGNNQNNQYNQGQYGGNQYYGGQPNMNQYNQGQSQMGYQNYQQPMAGGMNTYQYAPAPISKKEFYKKYADKGSKGNIQGAAILLYFSFALNFFVNFISYGNTAILIDCIIILTTALCIHILYSRIAAIIALVYSIVNVIMYLSILGKPGGWLILVAGICAVIGTFKLESEYKQHTGIR